MIANQTGLPAVAEVAYNKVGAGRGKGSPVGVLVGKTDRILAEHTVYKGFIASEEALKEAAARSRVGTRTREEHALSDLSEEQRVSNWIKACGFHTFRVNDCVRYLNPIEEEPETEASVAGILWAEKKGDAQGRKIVLLGEAAGEGEYAFFPGRFQEWQRCTKEGGNPRDSSDVKVLSKTEAEKLEAAFALTNAFDGRSTLDKMNNLAAKGPPSLSVWRTFQKRKNRQTPIVGKNKRARRDRAGGQSAAGRGKGSQSDAGIPPAPAPAGAQRKITAAERAKAAAEKAKQRVQMQIDAAVAAKVAAAQATAAALEGSISQKDAQIDALRRQMQQRQQLSAPISSPPPAQTPLAAHLPPQPRATDLPPGWKVAADGAGVKYYYNKGLRISQYEHPALQEGESPPLPPPTSRVQEDSSTQSPLFPNTPLVPPLSQPLSQTPGPSSSNTHSGGRVPFDVEQRRARITQIRGYLPYCEHLREKAELNGELAVLQREEHLYLQNTDSVLLNLL